MTITELQECLESLNVTVTISGREILVHHVGETVRFLSEAGLAQHLEDRLFEWAERKAKKVVA